MSFEQWFHHRIHGFVALLIPVIVNASQSLLKFRMFSSLLDLCFQLLGSEYTKIEKFDLRLVDQLPSKWTFHVITDP